MSLVVDRYELGPVGDERLRRPRRARSAAEAVVVDPGDADRLRLELAGRRELRGDPRSRTPTGITSAASPTSPRAPARRSTCRALEAPVLADPRRLVPGRRHCARTTPEVLLDGDETLELGGDLLRDAQRPGPLAGPRRLHADGALFSGDVLFAGSRRANRPPVRRLGDARRVDPDADGALPARDGRLLRPRPADDARRRARTQPVPRRAARLVKFEAPRGTHDVLPAEQPLWQRVAGTMESVCALYGYRRIDDARLRGHGAVRAHVRRGLRRRPEGDVHVRGPRRPLADAAARGRRRRSAAPTSSTGSTASRSRRSSTRSAPMWRYDRAAEGPLPRALAAVGGGDRLRRSGGRRRDRSSSTPSSSAASASPATCSS